MSVEALKRLLLIASLVLIGLAALALVASLAFVHSTQPRNPGAFYLPPSPLPVGPPGRIVRAESVADAPSGSREWKILYLSESYTGARTAVEVAPVAVELR